MAILISSPGVNLIFVNTCLTNRIMKKLNSSPSRLAALLGVACSVACGFLSAQAQVTATYTPANWTNDPYTSGLDPYYTLNTASANTAAPLFMLNSTSSEGSGLYGYSPIGATITLASPNQTAILTGTVTFLGASEAPGNNQFRYGLLYRGAQTADTGWMGYASGSPGTTTTTSYGTYLREAGNTGVFCSGTGAYSVTTTGSPLPTLGPLTRAGTFDTGSTYNMMISVTYLSSTSTLYKWTLQDTAGSGYLYAGSVTNNYAGTASSDGILGGYSFDNVGFLAGSTLFPTLAHLTASNLPIGR